MPSPPLSIVQSLSPRVAVLTSDDVADSCAANGCRGLDELLRPWEGGTERVSILSSTLVPTVHPSFPLRFVNYGSVYTNLQQASPNPDVVVDLISSCVGRTQPDDNDHYPITRALLLSSRPLGPHETFNHPVGVLLAISTSTPDPMRVLQQLHGRAVGTGAQAAPWMDGVQVLKFFVVVHDVSKMGPDLEVAHELLAAVKKVYGPHSTLLVINSRNENVPLSTPDLSTNTTMPPVKAPAEDDPDALSQIYASTMSNLSLSPMLAAAAETEADADDDAGVARPKKRYAAKLTVEDINRIIALVRELVVQSLVPWMEGRVREWNEAYQSNRRGLTGRLFGAGRKLFGGSRPTSPAPASQAGYNPIKGYYPVNSIEALARRLADFAFMLRDYRYATNVYDSLRRDYAQDRAWRHQAAATEMIGLTQLLGHGYFLPNTPPSSRPVGFTTMQHTEISGWLEQAVFAYQAKGGVGIVQLDALRVTVLFYEAWKAINEWRGVGNALVRAAGEADEVPCGVLIEEAAAADVRGGRTTRGRRRQAFHLVMAARRYEKAGLEKTFSRRCLQRAADLMRNAAWGAARDRIEYSLGRQAYNMGESDVAVEHFLSLLGRDASEGPALQDGVLEDMALAYENLAANPEQLAAAQEKLRLPTPLFDAKKTRIVLAAETSGAGDWGMLEERALSAWNRKGKRLASLLPDARRTVAAVGETFTVELTATNPLNAPLVLASLTIVLEPADADVEVEVVEAALAPYETRCIPVTLTPRAAGTFTVAAASFRFHGFLPCVESLARRGRRLHATKAQRLTPTYAKDTSLVVHAEAGLPRLAVELTGVPDTVYAGESVDASVTLRNVGRLEVENVQLVSNIYGVIATNDTPHSDTPTSIPNVIPSSRTPLTLHAGRIAPGATVSVPVTFTAPSAAQSAGRLDLAALAVFSAVDGAAGATHLTCSANVRRVLSVTTEILQARRGYLVVVEAMSHADTPLEIATPAVVSQYWSTRSSGESSTTQRVWPNQTLRAVLPIVPRAADETAGLDLEQAGLVANLGRVLRGELDRLEPISPPAVSLALPERSPGYLVSRRADRLRFAGEQFTALPADLVSRVLPLFDPLDLDVVLHWTTAGRAGSGLDTPTAPPTPRHGLVAVHGVQPGPRFSLVESLRAEADAPAKRTMYEETGRLRRALLGSVLEGVYAAEEDPIAVRASVDAKGGLVAHDFADGALTLPVTLELENRSPSLAARWILRLPAPQPGALWTGALSHRGTLLPGARTQVRSALWVTQPGVVSLGGWEVVRETGDGDPEPEPEPAERGEGGEGAAKGEVSDKGSEKGEEKAKQGLGQQWSPRASWASTGPAQTVEVVQRHRA